MSIAEKVVRALQSRSQTLATAESCTGGLIAAAITDVPGASDIFGCGVVSYSNEIKAKLLQVPQEILAQFGAVSPETAAAMARGVQALSGADWNISVTGIAGPGGGSATKPVGLVFMACCCGEEVTVEKHVFSGDRTQVRSQTVATALALLQREIEKK